MTMKEPTTVAGGDYLDLRALVEDGPILALFRIREFLSGEATDYNDPTTRRPRMTFPVLADVLICSGEHEGEAHLRETIKFAPSNALRGIGIKASEDGERPVNDPGDELPYIVSMIHKKGQQPFVGLDPAKRGTDARIKIEEIYADGAGWDRAKAPTPSSAPAPEPEPSEKLEPTREREPVGAAASAAGSNPRPWDR